ncbi:MAG TPA: lamin tail domain-containing protein [Tepidisphaeraceae bacterium]|nr:lamin tail domain-containing protein [Tepidisphaeraceae bacterium]
MKKAILASVLALFSAASSRAAIIISEVDPTGSSNSSYKADWFELTNTGASDQDITGWKMDDNSQSSASAVAIRGITSIPAGGSVVFIEDGAATNAANDPTIEGAFETAWFGSNVPTGFLIGAYGGSGVGLGGSPPGDQVNIFNASGTQITGVSFGAAANSPQGTSYDNAAGIGDVTTPPPAISTLSVAGTNGAFLSSDGKETGSPGTTVPEPASLTLLAGATLLLIRRRRSE